jgi:hypothetical protein
MSRPKSVLREEIGFVPVLVVCVRGVPGWRFVVDVRIASAYVFFCVET